MLVLIIMVLSWSRVNVSDGDSSLCWIVWGRAEIGWAVLLNARSRFVATVIAAVLSSVSSLVRCQQIDQLWPRPFCRFGRPCRDLWCKSEELCCWCLRAPRHPVWVDNWSSRRKQDSRFSSWQLTSIYIPVSPCTSQPPWQMDLWQLQLWYKQWYGWFGFSLIRGQCILSCDNRLQLI